jgi:FixJ family two-component response regulator
MKSRLKIALIEDNRFHALLFEQAVREKYPESDIAVYTTGKAFLAVLPGSRDDLIALDFHLPDIDGLQLLSLVRNEKPDIPIVMITGAGSEQIAVEAMKSGATDYITKNGDFSSTIPRVIRQAYQKQQLILKNRRLETKANEAEKLEMITTMASTLNHEINNPLMAILGNVELLLDAPNTTDESAAQKLRMIASSARRIQQITQQMANLISTSVTETPAGPMLKLKGRGSCRTRRVETASVVSTEKSD